jgi:hypothetical protein
LEAMLLRRGSESCAAADSGPKFSLLNIIPGPILPQLLKPPQAALFALFALFLPPPSRNPFKKCWA